MGQDNSKESEVQDTTPDHLSSDLAHKFAEKCFTPLELTHFKDNFRSLAEDKDGLQYWKEDTLCRFLSLPDNLGTGAIIYQMATYLGAFPFPSLAPAILTRESMVKVVVMMTKRYNKVLKRGLKDRNKLLFRSLAIHDRHLSHEDKEKSDVLQPESAEDLDSSQKSLPRRHAPGFLADIAGRDDDDEDDDELALAALDSLDVMDVYKTEHAAEYRVQQAQIPADNFRQLILLLLVLAPLEPEESLSSLAERVTSERLVRLKQIANNILWSFAPDQHPGINFQTFTKVVDHSLPFLFEGLNPLFEHFLFSKNLDLNRHRSNSTEIKNSPPRTTTTSTDPIVDQETELLTVETLSQLSFFIPGESLFHHLRLLYSGDSDGFSINSVSQKVLNWKAPTILLVSGRRIDQQNQSQHMKSFTDRLPHRILPQSSQVNGDEDRLIYGVYMNVPWKQTHKEAIGDSKTILFQLEPIHDVFHASSLNREYLTFNLESGIGVGVPPHKSSLGHSSDHTFVLGPVSLYLNDTLEFGVFTHDDSGGGAFGASRSRSGAWRDVFEIDALEIWGCGGDEEAAKQRAAWKWEEREAAARRGVTLGNDKDATYALLEMAGIVGGASRSGGSMA